MGDSTASPAAGDEGHVDPQAEGRSRFEGLGRKALIGAIVIVVLLLGSRIMAAIVPRWWAQRVGDITQGRLVFGSMFGVFVGLVFTVVPCFVLAVGWRLKRGWRSFALAAALALVAAIPNLLTLGIVLGTSSAAHDAERILSVEGTGFRRGSLVGAIVGLAIASGIAYLVESRRRTKRKASRLKAELDARE